MLQRKDDGENPYILATCLYGRDNNLNLIRFLAATVVLISHSFPLATGLNEAEPFLARVGMTAGTMAVDVFFFTSGLLLTNSLMARDSARGFVRARALRIFPALAVMLIIVIAGVGPMFSRLPVAAYFSDARTYEYLIQSITLVSGIGWVLPGLFELNPYPHIVNGSLWTLPYEIGMYGTLLGFWLIASKVYRDRPQGFSALILLAASAMLTASLASPWLDPGVEKITRLASAFYCGAAAVVLQRFIKLSFSLAALVTILTLLCFVVGDRNGFRVAYLLSFGYVVLALAFIPRGRIRLFNQVGDFSYGMYIYSYPIQQCLAAAFVGLSIWSMALYSFAVTLLFAMASWSLIEKPALALK